MAVPIPIAVVVEVGGEKADLLDILVHALLEDAIQPARGYAVEASDSLASWSRLSVTLQAVNGRIRADIPLTPADGKKFYRIVKP